MLIIAHDGDDDAVRIANDSPYGSAGGVWSGDEERALTVATRIRGGQVDINGAPFNPSAPFGGFKKSGIGREFDPIGLADFLGVNSLQR